MTYHTFEVVLATEEAYAPDDPSLEESITIALAYALKSVDVAAIHFKGASEQPPGREIEGKSHD
jgi:hypothetical protein